MVDLWRLTVEIHPVVDRVLLILGQDQVRVHVAQMLGHREMKGHFLPGLNGAEGRLAGRIKTVVIGMRHKRPPVFRVKTAAVLRPRQQKSQGYYLTGVAPQMSRA